MNEGILLLLVVLANGIFDAVVVAYLAGIRSKKALIKALTCPDEETFLAIAGTLGALLEAAEQPIMHSGEKDKETGKEIMISPVDYFTARGANAVMSRLRGLQGAVKAGSNTAEALLGVPLPRKGQSTGEYLMEQMGPKIAERLLPTLEKWLDERLKSQGGNVFR
jgi:hypothetical protein